MKLIAAAIQSHFGCNVTILHCVKVGSTADVKEWDEQPKGRSIGLSLALVCYGNGMPGNRPHILPLLQYGQQTSLEIALSSLP
jgi:hypothetical protein